MVDVYVIGDVIAAPVLVLLNFCNMLINVSVNG